jgi:hypothetical protein
MRIQVVGIVEDGEYASLAEDPQPAMFLPILQSPSTQVWDIPLIEAVSSQVPQSSRHAQNRDGVQYQLTWVAN